MGNLIIKFIINLRKHSDEKNPYGPLFHRFLPNGEKDSISKMTDNYKINFWFEQRGLQSKPFDFIRYDPSKKKFRKEDINKQALLDGGYLYGQIELIKIDNDLVSNLYQQKITKDDYEKLGKQIVKDLYNEIFEFVSILKFQWGQYWLRIPDKWDSRKGSLGYYFRFILNSKYYNSEFKKWIDFLPNEPIGETIYVKLGDNDYSDYISKKDWVIIRETYSKGNKVSKTVKYIQFAHSSYDSENYSKAFIELVTALEFAIEEYFENKVNHSEKVRKHFQRLNELPISIQFSNICLIGSYCNSEDLDCSLEAIEIRNKIVHEGLILEDKKYSSNFYCLAKTILKIINVSNCYFPKKTSFNEIKYNWG